MTHEEFPILPPEGEGTGQRYESASLSMESLEAFLKDTQFENRQALVDILSVKYGMPQKRDEQHIEMGMTRMLTIISPEELEKAKRGEIKSFKGHDRGPLSGHDPELMIHQVVHMQDESIFDLQIFKVHNRNQAFRFEYVLNPI